MNKSEQFSYISELIDSVPSNESRRFSCCFCHGFNSLIISKENGVVKWNCFRASCKNTKGSKRYLASVQSLKSSLQGRTEAKREFKLPQHLIYGLSSPKAVKMITEGHCEQPYTRQLFSMAYDPEADRVCFLVQKNYKIVGCIGKACRSGVYPKVLNYPNSDLSQPFIVGNTDIIVLTEDCLSAASVARIPQLSGLALLGTNLKDEYLTSLKKYYKVIIALDRDARKKALAMKRKLVYYHPTVKLWNLDKDIKNMTDYELLTSFNNLD